MHQLVWDIESDDEEYKKTLQDFEALRDSQEKDYLVRFLSDWNAITPRIIGKKVE